MLSSWDLGVGVDIPIKSIDSAATSHHRASLLLDKTDYSPALHALFSSVRPPTMLLPSLLPPLLLLPSFSDAKLWGWDDQFTIVARKMVEDDIMPWYWMGAPCNGWGNWCEHQECKRLQHFNVDLGGINKKQKNWYAQALQDVNYHWARIERENGAWIDLWRRGDGRFDMFENNKPPVPHGFCEPIMDPGGSGKPMRKDCNGQDTVVALACYQY